MFTRRQLAEVAEDQAKLKLVWKPGSEADKYKAPFFGVFGKGKWSWCAAFVRWCCVQAGLDIPVKVPANETRFGYTFALVEAWQQWAIFMGFYHDNDGVFEPEAGDITCFDWDQNDIAQVDKDWEDHIGVFLRMKGKNYECAEGNTSNMTNIKVRTPKQIQGWIRIPDGFSFNSGVSTPAPKPAPAPVKFGERLLRNGSRGEDVRALQNLLNKGGANLDEDGIFGDKTENALRALQKRLATTVDGVADLTDFAGLLESIGNPPVPTTPVPETPTFPDEVTAVPIGSAMKRVGPKGVTTRGLDVSHYQPTMDFAACKDAGYEFVFLKVSEGKTNIDRSFQGHAKAARKAGLLVGTYHFFRSTSTGAEQAEHFLRQNPYQKGDLPPVLDLEAHNGASRAEVVKRALSFCEIIESRLGVRPIIYTGPYFFKDHASDIRFAKYPLWIAHYATSTPLVPPPWKIWTFHQFTSTQKVPGRAGGVDANLFNGSLSELKARFNV